MAAVLGENVDGNMCIVGGMWIDLRQFAQCRVLKDRYDAMSVEVLRLCIGVRDEAVFFCCQVLAPRHLWSPSKRCVPDNDRHCTRRLASLPCGGAFGALDEAGSADAASTVRRTLWPKRAPAR